MAAAWEGDSSVAAELLKHGAHATLVNSERRSALMLAESEGHRAAVTLLIVK
jgi:ankyrin repeat protein